MQDENMKNSTNTNTDSDQSVKPVPTSNTIADPIAPSNSPVQSSGGNTSGQGSNAVVPEEVKGWSWGGFFLTWIWGVFNGVWLSLLAFIVPWPVMNVVLGVKGRELAWQSKRWESVEHFNRVQRKWTIAGIVLSVIPIILIPILVLIVIIAINPADRIREAEERQLQQNRLEQQDNVPGVIIPR